MPDLDLEPGEYREEGRARPRYTLMDWINYGLPTWWKVNQTDQRDKEFEGRAMNGLLYGLGIFIVHKLRGGGP